LKVKSLSSQVPRSMGLATVRLLAECGARVVVSSRKVDASEAVRAEPDAHEHDAIAIPACWPRRGLRGADRADSRSLRPARSRCGNVAVNPVFDPLESLSPHTWSKLIETNFGCPWHLARHALPAIAQGGAR
jgi:NAD(P)-dependent dehydrogenase (short-subunit alcohol dehydrogenase family)